jgi:hypothetical protein
MVADRSEVDRGVLLPGSRTVPRTVYWPLERRSLTSHEAMKPPAPVTHTLFVAAASMFLPFLPRLYSSTS